MTFNLLWKILNFNFWHNFLAIECTIQHLFFLINRAGFLEWEGDSFSSF